ncbi:uncharacterized protein N7483_008753 [Penicillium malachiteum]|uniref:uncharacterized protein n=1 Tax=Penicillium malachiteum TaxID=1324776 RepID=UPI002547BCE4|nr:uncharacterized protein N7483_008753 [Penicillium malachiteum]KAJ5720819.1 hypothetical protein N7483_008753 [Penicillium malachiteum]
MRPFNPNNLRALRTIAKNLKPASINPSTRHISTKLFRSQPLTRSAIPNIKPHIIFPSTIRHNSTSPLTSQPPESETDAEHKRQNEERRKNEEAYQITFTCKPCGNRSTHRMSKQGYHRGTVLIQCPSCKNRHMMSDHLGIFFDEGTTLEDILKKKGQVLTHGRIDGNMEFLDDGTVQRSEAEIKDMDNEGQQ